jgi:hypothetical protein
MIPDLIFYPFEMVDRSLQAAGYWLRDQSSASGSPIRIVLNEKLRYRSADFFS